MTCLRTLFFYQSIHIFYLMFHVKHLNLIMVLSPVILLFVDISLRYSCSSLFLQMIFRYLYLVTGILPHLLFFRLISVLLFLSYLTLHQFLRIYKVWNIRLLLHKEDNILIVLTDLLLPAKHTDHIVHDNLLSLQNPLLFRVLFRYFLTQVHLLQHLKT